MPKKSRFRWRGIRWAVYALSLLTGWLIYSGWWIPNEPPRWRYPVRGIDVSHHNGVIDWMMLRWGGIDFVFMKATEGADFRDTRFRENWEGAGRAGIARGAYHFFSTLSSGEKQAANFIAYVPKTPGMLPPVIDLEFEREYSAMSRGEFHANLKVLSARLEAHYGMKPILYMPRRFHREYFPKQPVDRLWVRSVVGNPHALAQNWMFWQYTDRGRAPGIEGRVDLNVFFGGDAELQKLRQPAAR